jgi:hypothetical protein
MSSSSPVEARLSTSTLPRQPVKSLPQGLLRHATSRSPGRVDAIHAHRSTLNVNTDRDGYYLQEHTHRPCTSAT